MDKMEGKTEGTSWANMNKERVRQGYKKLTTKNYKRLKDETYKGFIIQIAIESNDMIVHFFKKNDSEKQKGYLTLHKTTKDKALTIIKNIIDKHLDKNMEYIVFKQTR